MNTNEPLYKAFIIPALATGFLLLIPLLAMQFSNEVAWTLSDFIIAGVLLFGTGLTYKLITRKSGGVIHRVAVGFALFTGLFLIWVNLAVGIIGSEDNPANLMYFGVVAVGIIGAFIARFKVEGLALTMFAMALAQAVVAVIVLLGGLYQSPPSTVFHIAGINGFFITLFVVAGLLFRYVAQERAEQNAA